MKLWANTRLYLISALTISGLFSGCTLGDEQAGVTECGNTEGVTECGNTDTADKSSFAQGDTLSSADDILVSSEPTLPPLSSNDESSDQLLPSSTQAVFVFKGAAVYEDGTIASNARVRVRTQDYLAAPELGVVDSIVVATKQGVVSQAVDEVEVVTDADGRFEINALPPGNYNIEVNDNTSKAAMHAVSVGATEIQLSQSFVLQNYATVTGAVEFVENVKTYAKIYGLERYTEVDESGRYLLDSIPPGEYKVRIEYEEDDVRSGDLKDSVKLEQSEAGFIPTEMPYVIYVDEAVENSINFWTQTPVEFQDSTQELGSGQIGTFPFSQIVDKSYLYYTPAFGESKDNPKMWTEGYKSLYVDFDDVADADRQPGSLFFYFPNVDNKKIAHRRDLRPWMKQNLVFDIRTSFNMSVKVGSRESDAINPENPEDRDIVADIFDFGATDAWVWETVSIPLSHFSTADFSQIKVVFFIEYRNNGDAFIDNIRFEPVGE